MHIIRFQEISFINAVLINHDRTAFGCNGIILYGDRFAEIHAICSGFYEQGQGAVDEYMAVIKNVISTDNRDVAKNLFNKLIKITDTKYITSLEEIYISNLIRKFAGADGCSLDLLSSDKRRRTIDLVGHESSVIFTIVGSRIRGEHISASGASLPFDTI